MADPLTLESVIEDRRMRNLIRLDPQRSRPCDVCEQWQRHGLAITWKVFVCVECLAWATSTGEERPPGG